MESLMSLFHSDKIGPNDANGLLYSLFRIIDGVENPAEGSRILQDFWNGDIGEFVTFALH